VRIINKEMFLLGVFVFFILAMLVISFNLKSIDEEKEEVYIQTDIGCVKILHKYTESEWNFRQDFFTSMGIEKVERCSGVKY
jgi:hypothetical protein